MFPTILVNTKGNGFLFSQRDFWSPSRIQRSFFRSCTTNQSYNSQTVHDFLSSKYDTYCRICKRILRSRSVVRTLFMIMLWSKAFEKRGFVLSTISLWTWIKKRDYKLCRISTIKTAHILSWSTSLQKNIEYQSWEWEEKRAYDTIRIKLMNIILFRDHEKQVCSYL